MSIYYILVRDGCKDFFHNVDTKSFHVSYVERTMNILLGLDNNLESVYPDDKELFSIPLCLNLPWLDLKACTSSTS